MVNVYSKCVLFERRAMRENLLYKNSSFGGFVWCIPGDPNLVCSSSDRVEGVGPYSHVICVDFLTFNSFIYHMDLCYLLLLGRKFT